jgi:hypothetical protein
LPKPKTAPKRTARGAPALRLARLRSLHVYVSAFVAPSLIFFAGTGVLQTFRLPDKPAAPPLIVKLARLHKDDVFAMKPARPKARGDQARPPAAAKPSPKASTEALKWFFSAASVGMIASTVLGLWMALAHHKRRLLLGAVVVAGAVIPAVLAAFAT